MKLFHFKLYSVDDSHGFADDKVACSMTVEWGRWSEAVIDGRVWRFLDDCLKISGANMVPYQVAVILEVEGEGKEILDCTDTIFLHGRVYVADQHYNMYNNMRAIMAKEDIQ